LTDSRRKRILPSTKLKKRMGLRICSTYLIPFSARKDWILQQYVEYMMPAADSTKISLYSRVFL